MGRLNNSIKVILIILYLAIIIVSITVCIIPINGNTIWQLADLYPSLIRPANYTYSIMIPIELLLLGFTLFQLGLFNKGKTSNKMELFSGVRILYIISTIAYFAGIFALLNDYAALSLMLIIVVLISMIAINKITSVEAVTLREKLFVKLPFSIYFGWITYATFINASSFLESIGWQAFGISEMVWTSIVIILSSFICLAVIMKYKNIAFGLTIIWSYIGLIVKHISKSGYNGQYPAILVTLIVSIILMLVVVGYIILIYRRSNSIRAI